MPTTYLAFLALKYMWDNRERYLSAESVAGDINADACPDEIDVMLRQLEMADIVIETESQPKQYRYKLDTENVYVPPGSRPRVKFENR